MANVRKPIIENPVYSEILIILSNEPKTVTDILTYYNETSDLFDEKPSNTKSQPVLREQLLLLKKKGYVSIIEEEANKNVQGNKKTFFILWEKIIEEFIGYVIKYYKEGDKNTPSEFKLQQINDLKKSLDKFKKNFFIQNLFKFSFDSIRRTEEQLLIKEIFDDFLNFNFLENSYKSIIKSLGHEDIEVKDWILSREQLKNEIGDIKANELMEFRDFVYTCPTSSKYDTYTMHSFSVGNSIAEIILPEHEYKRISNEILHRDIVEIQSIDDEPYYPHKARDELVEAEGVIGVVKRIEEIRKNKRFNDVKRIKSMITEIKRRYYFVTPFRRNVQLIELKGEKRIFYLRRYLFDMELGIIQHYHLGKNFPVKEIIKHIIRMYSNHDENY